MRFEIRETFVFDYWYQCGGAFLILVSMNINWRGCRPTPLRAPYIDTATRITPNLIFPITLLLYLILRIETSRSRIPTQHPGIDSYVNLMQYTSFLKSNFCTLSACACFNSQRTHRKRTSRLLTFLSSRSFPSIFLPFWVLIVPHCDIFTRRITKPWFVT